MKPGGSQFLGNHSTQKKNDTSGSRATSPIKAWIFAITPQETRESNEVVTCTFSKSNKLGSILFDYGASHLFVFNTFSTSLPIDIDFFVPALTVMML